MGFAESTYADLTWEGKSVQLDQIEQELHRLRGEAAATEGARLPGHSKVLNLVVFAKQDTHIQAVHETVGRVSGRHPMRAIIVAADPDSVSSSLDTRIHTYCCQDPATGAQLTCEQLLIVTTGEPARHVTGVVEQLLITDLPTYLWWSGEPEYKSENFSQLMRIAKKLILDSNTFASSAETLRQVAASSEGRSQVCAVTDLNWVRLSRWFEAVAQCFDDPRLRPHLSGIQRVRVEYAASDAGADAPPTQAALLAGWLFSRLGVPPERVEFETSAFPVPGGQVTMFEIETYHGEQGLFQVRMKPHDRDHAVVRAKIGEATVLEHSIHIGARSDAELLDVSLESCQRDLPYEESLVVAAALLERNVAQ